MLGWVLFAALLWAFGWSMLIFRDGPAWWEAMFGRVPIYSRLFWAGKFRSLFEGMSASPRA